MGTNRSPRLSGCPACLLMLAVIVVLAACSSNSGESAAGPVRWQPKPATAPWQFQLQGSISTSIDAPVYEVDGFDVSAGTVKKLHRLGRRVICYVDVGSWENYRPDAKRFPRSVLGRRYEGYPDERWLDIRRFHRFSGLLRERIRMCARKGFDALEPDNINGWENPTGFPITRPDQLRFNRWIARVSHRNGLSVALKNDGRQARQLAGQFDFAVVEQCFQYRECGWFRPFIRRGKAVFEVEYERPRRAFCAQAKRMRFSAISKRYSLFARPWRPCPG